MGELYEIHSMSQNFFLSKKIFFSLSITVITENKWEILVLLYSFQPTSYIFPLQSLIFVFVPSKRGHNFTFNLLNLLIQKKKKKQCCLSTYDNLAGLQLLFSFGKYPSFAQLEGGKGMLLLPHKAAKSKRLQWNRQGRSIFVKSMLMQKQIQNQFYNESL